MGVSFKVSKAGTKFRPKPPPPSDAVDQQVNDHRDDVIDDSSRRTNSTLKSNKSSAQKLTAEVSEANEGVDGVPDSEVSFTLSLFPDGYSIGKPSENEIGLQTSVDIPKFLHPYDRASEALFSAIESGRLPGDILDDIPCKYRDGTLVCELRDYRNCSSEAERSLASTGVSPLINKVHLRMSLENVVKDIPSISDNSWTYGDLMEVESRILKALQPQLCLDPTPKLERLCENPASSKLKLDLCSLRRKRLRQIPDVTVMVNNKFGGKKVCVDRMPEGSRMGDSVPILQQPGTENLNIQSNGPNNMLVLRTNSFGSDSSLPASPLVPHQSNYQMGVGNSRLVQSGAVISTSAASPAGQEMLSCAGNVNPAAVSVHGKRDSQDGQSSPLSTLNKRSRLTPMSADGNQQHHVGPQMDRFPGPDSHWKNTLLQQQPSMARNIQYANSVVQKYPQQMFEWGLSPEAGATPFTMGQQGLKGTLKEEPVETERLDKPEFGQAKNDMLMTGPELSNMDSQQSRLQQRLPQQFQRSGFPQASWNNLGQPLDNNARKEDHFQKRKLVQSPRVSTGGLPQSPLSSKSGEFSSGSIGPQFGNVTSGLVASQKEKSAVTSGPPVGGTTSFTSSANDSVQRQQQAQIAAKRRSNSLPKTPVMSGVGSPASVSNMSVPINASSPPVGTQPLAADQVLERFSKIEMVATRFQLNYKKNKVDEHPIRKSIAYSNQHLLHHLSSDSNSENLKDEKCNMPLSKSLIGGGMNVCKTRILNCVQTEQIPQGNSYMVVTKARTRLIMSEKPNDGIVALHIGDIEDAEYLAAEDYLPTLPNTHIADLLAAQFSTLMQRDGYHIEDLVQPKPIRMNRASSNQPSAPGVPQSSASAEPQQYCEAVSGQPSNDIAKPSNSNNTPANSSNSIQGPRMLSPGNAQALQISQGLMPAVSMSARPQQPDQLPPLQQQQSQHMLMQQHSQLQRSPLMLSANPMQHLNHIGQNSTMQLGAHVGNKPSPLQLQMLQQQQQQQQQPQIQRKMMSLGNVGMGNMGNNTVGLGALGNVMNMGGVRGVGGTGISAPMGSISGIGNVGQNLMNLSQASNISNAISQQIRSRLVNPEHANMLAQKLRAQNKTNMLGGAQPTMGGMAGARQMHAAPGGLSMLGPTLNRANINSMQRTAIGPMGPPKLMAGMNLYMPQQQQQQQLQIQQQQMQLQQQQQMQHQQLQQQQETTSPLQAVVAPPQMGSPSNMGIPQQMNQQSQQQQQQQQQHQSSPQQMSQRTPLSPQLSSGAIHPLSAGNMEACPASPQLSSQTLGSVGSITNSPMELQGVNKNNSSSNA